MRATKMAQQAEALAVQALRLTPNPSTHGKRRTSARNLPWDMHINIQREIMHKIKERVWSSKPDHR